jgi:hypothetical protein
MERREEIAMKILSVVLACVMVPASVLAQSATVTLDENLVLQASPHRIGINIGSETYYDSGQILKNLLAEDNAGFEPFQLRQIWAQEVSGTKTTFTTTNQYVQVPLNRLVGASYKIVESATAAKGCTGIITGNTTGDGYSTPPVYTLGTPCAAATSPGDQLVVTWVESPTPEATWESSQNGAWGSVSNGGKLTSDTKTPYDGAQSMVLDTSAGNGAAAQVNLYFDSNNLNTWVRLNGTYTMSVAAKLVSGNATLTYTVGRFATGGARRSALLDHDQADGVVGGLHGDVHGIGEQFDADRHRLCYLRGEWDGQDRDRRRGVREDEQRGL